MNSTRQERIEEQASLWAARLEGSNLTAADRAELDAWLSHDPLHRKILSEYCQFSADLEEQLPALVTAGSVAMPAKAESPAPRVASFPTAPSGTPARIIRWSSFGLAAAAAIAAGIWFGVPGLRYEKITAPVAQRQNATLPDGTRVELSGHTTLLVEHFGRERRVRLPEGEAFFQVAKDKEHPFIVTTPNGSVRVTGTQFDVRTAPAELDVTLVEGSVKVQAAIDGAAPVTKTLSVNERLSARSGGVYVQPLPDTDVEDLLAWRQGRLVCDGMLLRDVLARLGHYNGRVMSASPASENLKVGGTFSLDDPETFLEALPKMFTPAVRVEREDGTVRVSLANER